MTDLTEFEQRVLAELEEVWEQNVFSMLNTIIDPKGGRDEVGSLQEALKDLIERDYATMGFEGLVPKDPEELGKQASLLLASNLDAWFKFDSKTSYWTLSKGDINKARIPMIYSTAAAREKAFEILDERGYQWWRQKK